MNRMQTVSERERYLYRRRLSGCVLVVLAFVSVAFSLMSGPSGFGFQGFLSDESAQKIFLYVRIPRVLCAFLVGFGLAVVGGIYQSLFKNYLASPFTLGVSSGAALMASIAILAGLAAGGGALVGVWALVGAMLSVGCILSIHRIHVRRDSFTLLLVGVVFSFFCSSLMVLVQYVANYAELFQVTRWLMGSIGSPPWDVLLLGFFVVALTFVWGLRNARVLDLFLFGDDMATVKGVDVNRQARIVFIFSSMVVGWIVAQCGVIGFVGIVVPAIARLLVGLPHRRVLPAAGLLGAILVLLCDALGRVVIAPFEIPAGVFTSVIGGPMFIWLVIRGR